MINGDHDDDVNHPTLVVPRHIQQMRIPCQPLPLSKILLVQSSLHLKERE
jgi:hypothetical protein